jgi:membrane-associated phospholipid phosphatase
MPALTRIVIARFVSIVGHPLPLLSAAAIYVAHAQGASRNVVLKLALTMATLAGLVMLYSLKQVRSGHWVHVDASRPRERRALNAFLATLLIIGAVVSWKFFPSPRLAIALLMSGIAVIVALGLARWLKVSLHVCFAVFAAGLLWPEWTLLAMGAIVATAVAWSRLTLLRHTPVEVAVGAVLGAAIALGNYSATLL